MRELEDQQICGGVGALNPVPPAHTVPGMRSVEDTKPGSVRGYKKRVMVGNGAYDCED